MSRKNDYVLIFKTGEAEIRAIKNTDWDNANLFPLIELTRGRKSKNNPDSSFKSKLRSLYEIFHDKDIWIDTTTDPLLSNKEIDSFFEPDNGYSNWTSFLISLKKDALFGSIAPTILVNTYDHAYRDNLAYQVEVLCKNFNSIVYRNNIYDDGCYDDLEIIKKVSGLTEVNFYFVIDCGYVPSGAVRSFVDKINSRISKIINILPNVVFVLSATSFPKNISEIGKDDHDTFALSEIQLHEIVTSINKELRIIYSDYGSINPIRNDQVVMSKGWIPRIDIPLENEIFYYRLRKNQSSYSQTYTRLAREYVLKDDRFPFRLKSNWGIAKVISCSQGEAPGASPSFWISVRMNIHITQQLKRLNNK